MRAEYAALAASATLLLAACGGVPATTDAGVDGGQDAGPPYVRFAPRFLFNDPTVRCVPPPPLEMLAPVGPRPPRGTVRWTYDPNRDPGAAESFSAIGIAGVQFSGTGLLGMPSGGLVLPLNEQRYYLAVTPEGEFDFFLRAAMSHYGPSWLMPSTLITRPSPDVEPGTYLSFVDTTSISVGGGVSRGASFSPLTLPVALPGGVIDDRGPAVLADGTIVATPTHRTLMAGCSDGRPRWVLEYYNIGHRPSVYATGDGNIVLEAGPSGIYRIDADGNVLASRDDSGMSHISNVLGYSDRCGLAFTHYEYDNGIREYAVLRGVQYLSGEDFTVSRELPGTWWPTTDCGAWGWPADSTPSLRRYRPDGSLGFEYAMGGAIVGGDGPIELVDGSWLFVRRGGGPPPGFAIVADDGTVTFDMDLDPAVVGDQLSDLYLLTPHGILYEVASSGVFADGHQLVAIEIGLGRAMPWFGYMNTTGGTWARDNAAWH